MINGYNAGDVEVIRETDLAILVSDGDVEDWIPKSVIHEGSEVWELGQQGDLVVMEWFAEKQGWL